MSRYAARRMQTKNVAFAFVVALVASLLIWTPSWQNPWAVASGDLGYDSEVDHYGEFDGTASYADRGSSTAVIPNDTSITAEAWVKPRDNQADPDDAMAVLTQNQDGGGTDNDRFGLFLIQSNDRYQVHLAVDGNTVMAYTDVTIPYDAWTHIAAVLNATAWQIYIDGQLALSGALASSTIGSSNGNFHIGSTGGSSRTHFFNGAIDQVKIWDEPLTADEIASSMHAYGAPSGVTGLIAHYDFNEGSGSTIYDRVGSNDLGTSGVGFQDVKQVATADDGDTVIAFPRTYLPGVGGWMVPQHFTAVEALVVAGGGGGGAWIGGGGGAGGFLETSLSSLQTNTTLSVIVGQGGLGAYFEDSDNSFPEGYDSRANSSGQASTLSGVTVPGGGAGANFLREYTVPAASGASGGGGSAISPHHVSGSALAGGFGFAGGGGNPDSAQPHSTGGGGGAGGAGGDFVSATQSGVGGVGTSSSLVDEALATTLTIGSVRGGVAYFAGGGGGSLHGNGVTNYTIRAEGGLGGGGAGSLNSGSYPSASSGSPGLPNTGGGGGGGANNITAMSFGGNGGSGVIVLRFSPITLTVGKLTLGYGEATSITASGGVGSGELSIADTSGNCTVASGTVTMKQNSSGSCTIVATRAADTSGGYPAQSTSATITPENRVDLGDLTLAASSTTSVNPTFYVQDATNSGMVLAASLRVSGSGTLTMGSTGQQLIADEALLAASPGFSDVTDVTEISLRGSASLLDQALSDVTFNAGVSGASGQLILNVVEIPEDLLFNSVNGHYYEFSSSESVPWSVAKSRAATQTLFGQVGYLATVTSADENSFITEKTGGTSAWLGGSDDYDHLNTALGEGTFANQSAAEGKWYWVTGPEAGTKFFDKSSGAIDGVFQYWNWSANQAGWGSEPNNAGSNEHYLQIRAGASGNWNDLPNASTLPFVIEFGGLGDFVRIEASVSPTVTIVEGSGAPSSLTATQTTSSGQIDLSWTAPVSDGGSAITDYIVEYKPAGGSWTSFSDGVSTNTTATVTGLQPCLAHDFRVSGFNGYFYSAASSTASATPVWGNFSSLTGVQISSTNSECVVTFTDTTANTWSPPAGTDLIRALVVGGGGGGGAHVGGGGGGGGFIDDYVAAVGGEGVQVAVGAGGAGGSLTGTNCTNAEQDDESSFWNPNNDAYGTWCGNPANSTAAENGQDSVFGSLTAVGGGRGGHWSYISPSSGGSGGGGSYYGNYATTDSNEIASGAGQGESSGDYVQGYAGAIYRYVGEPAPLYPTGGGGGAGGPATMSETTAPGWGGPGRSSTISGSVAYFAGGGGGGNHGHAGSSTATSSGGIGGGGDGSYATTALQSFQNGESNTGGGGGGGGYSSNATSYGGNGGSGVIILRQVTIQAPAITAQPASASASPGESAAFSVTASVDFGTVTYQWQESSDGSTWADVGINSSSHSVSGLSSANNGYQYRVVVSNYGNGVTESVTSSVATLTISGVDVGSGLCTTRVADDTGVTISATAGGGCLLEFKSSGNNVWTVPANVSSIEVLTVGGGGGGAGGRGGKWYGGGGGGGGGAALKSSLAVTTSQEISITVGAGGNAGGNASAGSGGGSTSFSGSDIVVAGGSGGNTSATLGVGGFGGSGGSSGGSSLAGARGGDGADGLASRTYQRPTVGGTANAFTLGGETYCVGGGGGGGNRGVDGVTHYFYQAAGGGCSAESLDSGGAGRYYNGSAYLGAETGVANTGGGGGGGSYTSGGGTSGAAGADGIVAIYYVPGAGSVALSDPGAQSYSANANVSITLTKDSSGTATWTSADSSICTVSGDNSTGTAVVKGTGICSVTATIAPAGGYSTGSAQVSFRIDKVTQTAPAWDSATIDAAFGSTVDLYEKLDTPSGSGYSFTVTGTGCVISGFNLTMGDVGDDCVVYPVKTETSIYLEATGTSMTVTVTKISQSALVITSNNTFAVDSSVTVSAAGGSGTGDLSYHVADQGTTGCSINSSTGALTATSAGDCEVYAKRAASTNYDVVTSSHQIVTVTKVSQTLLFSSVPPVTVVAGQTYTPSATASSGLSPAFTLGSGAGSVCSIAAGTVTFLSSGDCEIEAYQVGNGSYLAAATISQTVSVGRANQSMTFSAIADKLWGTVAFSLSATASSGLTIGYAEDSQTTNDACDVTGAGVVTIKNVGVCAITATQAGNGAFGSVAITRVFNVNAQQAGAPFIGSVSFGDRQLTALFYRPSYLGGGTVAAYELRAYNADDNSLVATNTGCSATGATNSCTVIGLTNGTTYVLKVAALTQAGTGIFSASSSQIAPASNPEAVRNLVAIEGDGQLTVQWDQPTSLGGGSFDQYRIFWRAPGGSYQSNGSPGATVGYQASTSYVITGLTNGVSYDVKVTTVTSNNTLELQSNTAEVNQTPYTVPDPPTSVTALDNDSNLVVAWQPPTFDGGNAIAQYVVTKDGTTVCTLGSAFSTSCEVSKPSAGNTSTIEVKAGNDAGLSTAGATTFTVASVGGSGSSGSSGGSGGSGGSSLPTITVTPTPTPSPEAPPSKIGFDPTPPEKPVAETGPIGTVESGEVVSIVADAPKENLVAKGSGWEIKVNVEDETGQVEPVQADLSLRATMTGRAAMSGQGLKPNTFVEVWVFSEKTYIGTVEVNQLGEFASELRLPETLLPGEHTLQIGTLNGAGELITLSIPLTVKGKVTVGTFKGYTAIYTADIIGQRLSAKIAGKWVVQDPISEFKRYSYSRLVRSTGAGYDIIVDVYINRKFYERKTIRTR